jgi:glycine/D-amino acid oxidase-like deaminating enzyme
VTAPNRADAIVVGAGIVGAACAAALARDGWRVAILEQDFAASGTTSVGMGHIVVMDDSPEQLALTSYSERLWRTLGPELGPRAELDLCGTLWVAEDESQLAALETKRDVYASAGVRAEILDQRALLEAEPNLRPDLAGALRVPGDSVVYPPGAAVRLIERACSRGAELYDRTGVHEIVANGVKLADGTTRQADVVINATGAHATQLISGLPIVPRKGHLAITDRYPGMCRHQLVELGYLASAHVMTNESVAFNVQPRPTGQLLIGSSRELAGWDARVNPAILQRMLERAVAFVPRLRDLSVIRCWTGFRPATPDKLPLVGRWDPVPGAWIAAGHEGLGITTCLATAQLIADQLAGRQTEIDAMAYSPMRTATREPARQ